MERGPYSQFPDALDPVLSLVPYHGDLGLDAGGPQSVYRSTTPAEAFPSSPTRADAPRSSCRSADRAAPRRPGLDPLRRRRALGQAAGEPQPRQGRRARRAWCSAIVGLMGSLFIRPRRAWVRARREDGEGGGRTVVELAGLDRSRGATSPARSTSSSGSCRTTEPATAPRGAGVSTADFATFSDNAIMFASIVYILAFLAHLAEWVARSLPVPRRRSAGRCRRPRSSAASASSASRRDVVPADADGEPRSCGSRSTAASALAAHRARVRCTSWGWSPAAWARPGAGALGQHVRVHPGRHVRRERDVPRADEALPPALDGRLVTGFLWSC